MKIAAIITNYNYSDRVGIAIQSMLDQRLKPDCIVVVDDCSTDKSMQTFKKFANHIELYQTPAHSGQSTAKNIGVVNCPQECDIIAFLDADDVYHPEMLFRSSSHLTNSDIGLVYADAIEINHTTGHSHRVYREPFSVERHLQRDIVGGNFVARKDVVKKVGGFDPGLYLWENYDLTRRMMRETMPYHMPYSLVECWSTHRSLRQKALAQDWEISLKKVHAKN